MYVGLKIVLKDKSVKAAYISDRVTGINTDIYREDVEEAEKIKKMGSSVLNVGRSLSKE